MPARDAARDDRIELDRAERIVLSERDSDRVLELLENPPEPTAALITAACRRGVKK